MYKLSPSALNLIHECPRCFWLDKHNIWKRPNGIFPSLPSGMDIILKIHFDKFCEKGLLPPELCKNKDCNGLKLFNDPEIMKAWRSNFKGIRWEDSNENVLFGAIDNLLVKGDKFVVLDYKTRGFPLKEDTSDHYKDQLDIYNLLLRKNGFKTEDYAYLLFYIPKEVTETGEVSFNTQLVRMDVDVNNAENIFNKALELLKGECPEKTCEWCKNVNSVYKV
ncbi:MAG TPA: PD-(D/E)XK nuclease family protein [Candidatus Nanoarchaeia archaeon]|nr:PD-(D/E)XK nuclease family protein [Candidatus Nanoarchaeia archaeon]